MKKLLTLLGIFFLFILFPSTVLAEPVGKFTHIEGRVDITSPGEAARPAMLGDEVNAGDIIRTKSEAKAEITFVDGNILRLAKSTRMKITEYLFDKERTSGILKLYRGKIQNKVKKLLGRVFGLKKRNRFEVHTPTAVVGVRGTNFFTYFLRGISGASFKEGSGYGYSLNRPDEVRNISPGQAMVVISPDLPPVIRDATDVELNKHEGDTTPSEKEEEEKVEAEEVTEEKRTEEREAAEEAPTEKAPVEETSAAGAPFESAATEEILLTETATSPETQAISPTEVSGEPETTVEPPPPVVEPVPSLPTTTIGTFEGRDTYWLVKGTFYESDFTGSHYEYRYFISEDDVLSFGEKWLDLVGGDETGNIYLPDGMHFNIIEEGHLTVAWNRDDWTVGSLSPTSFSEPPAGYSWDRTWYEVYTGNSLARSGEISGTVQATGYLLTPGVDSTLSLSGSYMPADGNYDKPSIFGVEILQSNIAGFLGGVIDDVKGDIYGVYIDSSQNAGIVDGTFAGGVNHSTGGWNASGSIHSMQTATGIGISPDNLEANLERGYMAAWVGGDFGTLDSEIGGALGWGKTLSIKGLDFGVFQLSLATDTWFENPHLSNTWSARAGGWGQFGRHIHSTIAEGKPDIGIWLTDSINGTLENGMLTAGFTGKLLTLSMYADTAGRIVGTVDIPNNGWQAVASGYWNNNQKLQFNGILRGEVMRTRANYHGWGSGSEFNYDYDEVSKSAWSYYDDGATITHTDYYPDGTTESWTENYSGTPLSYSEGTWGNPSTDSLHDILKNRTTSFPYYENDTYPFYSLTYAGWFEGFLGGLNDLWAATYDGSSPEPGPGADTRIMGEFDQYRAYGDLPSVFTGQIKSYNPYDGTSTIWNQADNSQNGAYSGVLGGRTRQGSVLVDAMLLALYLDRSGTAGILKGIFEGEAHPGPETFELQGSIIPIPLKQGTGYNAADLVPSLVYYSPEDHPDLFFHGKFLDVSKVPENFVSLPSNSVGGDIHLRHSHREQISISGSTAGVPWILGVLSTLYGGTYQEFGGSTFNHWYVGFSGDTGVVNRQGTIISSPNSPATDGSWSGNLISGKGFGAWTHWDAAVTGVSGADLKGTFDPNTHTWQASAMWAYMDTNTFLNLAGTEAGRNKLAQLNIPAFQIGKADLSGSYISGGNSMNVTMKDVTFFTYSTGSIPRIWATNQVTGSYTGSPASGWSANLTGSNYTNASGLTAQFGLHRWDTGTKQWGANINNGNGTVNNKSINFSGGAAGLIDTAGNKFAGTGSGRAALNTTP